MSGSTAARSRFDVAVVGGGPAGLATAAALRRAGFTVLVIERTDYRSLRIGEHLPPGAKAVLAALGLEHALASRNHAACPGIRSVWGSEQPVDRDYLFHPHGEGLNLLRPEFDRDVARLVEEAGAVVLSEARIVSLRRAAGEWELTVRHSAATSRARVDLLVDATGRNASVAKRLGAKPIVYDELIGLVARVPSTSPRNNLLVIEAIKDGWWYSAGLADGSVIATFMTDRAALQASSAKRVWHERLAAAPLTATRIAEHESVNVQVRTARTQRLDEPVGDHWLAVGDAAMSFDPLSSEGIAKGVEWGHKAAAIAAALCRGDRAAAPAYCDDIARTFANYLVTRYRYYAAEKRWPEAPFWRRRQIAPKPIAARVTATNL